METEAPSPFCRTLPALQFAWDSMSLGDLKTCPQKYKYTRIDGWQSKRTKPSLAFGLLFHTGLETFDSALLGGAQREDALRAALRKVLTKGHQFQSEDTTRTKFTLCRSIIWYVDQYHNDQLALVALPSGKHAIERKSVV